MKTMIIGSSHISRLNKFMESDFDLNLQHHTIKIKGYSGGKVNTLYRSLVEIHEFNPDTIILQIDSNDIGDIHTSVENVVLSIECLYDVLMSINVKLVVVSLLFDRSQVMMRRGLSVNEYNARVDSLSLLLYDMSLRLHHMSFWIHRGLQYQNVRILDKDGVHLNREGNHRLATSIRGIVLYTERIIWVNYLCTN